MLPRSFLSQLTLPRVAKAMRRIEAAIWKPISAAGIRVSQSESFRSHRSARDLEGVAFAPVDNVPFFWGPKYAQRWFKLELPPLDGDEPIYLRWNDSAEGTAYIDGKPYYGLDLAHRFCPLPQGAREVLIESVCIKTGIWLNGHAEPLAEEGSEYRAPELLVRDDEAWKCFHDLKVLAEVMEAELRDTQNGTKKDLRNPVRYTAGAFRASPLFRRLSHSLEEAIDCLDSGGVKRFAEALADIYARFPAERDSIRATLTGHAHIDLVWLWPESVGEFKAIHSWATQLRLMERYEEYRFGFSQPACYDAVQRRAPELYEEMRERLREGKWEATGGSFVESDTQLPCGEALVRSLRLGQEGFRKLRGEDSTVFWLPDVFGYSGVMPQLLRGFGIESFFTTKLSWSTVNQFPHSSFLWRGYDGSVVRSHVVLLHDYNEAVDVRNLREDVLHHQQAAVHPEFLVPTGYGDGGGGPTEEMCERARRVANLSGMPRVGWGSIESFFSRMAESDAELPVVAGELPLELHRGVFTTHGSLKAAFRRLERSLQVQEAAHVAKGLGPISEHGWRRLVFAQFHDFVPGSSIWEVYGEGIPELERLAGAAVADACEALGGAGAASKALFNPLPEPRRWISGETCYCLPAMGGGPLSDLERHEESPPLVDGLRLASERVRASFDASGGITRLVIDGREVAMDAAGHELVSFADDPAMFEAWDLDRGSLVCGERAVVEGEPEAFSDAASASLTFTLRVGQSLIRSTYSVRIGEPVLRIDYDVDWQDPAHLLKAVFKTRYSGREARYGAPFGSVLRNQWPGYSREEALWEVPASRWMVVMDDAQQEGLAVITEAKYGFSVRDGVVGLSLLRSALVTEADLHPEIREMAERPTFSDLGRQQIRVALGVYAAGAARESNPAALADSLFTPCLPYEGGAIESGLIGIRDAPSLVGAWAEPMLDVAGGWILRLHETLGCQGRARIALAPGWRAGVLGLSDRSVSTERRSGWSAEALELSYGPYATISVGVVPGCV